jgi:hypothetical protein
VARLGQKRRAYFFGVKKFTKQLERLKRRWEVKLRCNLKDVS